MNATILLITFFAYTALLFVIAWATSRKSDNQSFFTGNRKSNWFLVAYGMIGASLSGVSFMSVPGNVYNENFYYLPMLLGFIAGYGVIAFVLLPLYFKMNLTSIYTYLDKRFGNSSYKTGASFFILSRLLGATVRTFLVVYVLYNFVFQNMGIPFSIVAIVFVAIAILYTMRGGVKTIVWTDTMQTTFMIVAIVAAVVFICNELNWSFGEMISSVFNDKHSDVFDTNWTSSRNWIKQFISGAIVPIAMTGLDQAMMQKSLSCKNIGEAKKNVITSVAMMIPVNVLFLTLGAILAIYVGQNPELLNLIGTNAEGSVEADKIFPVVAFSLKAIVGIFFFIGLISAAYPTCANALTSLTTSSCIDIINMEKRDWDEKTKKLVRMIVMFLLATLFVLLILIFNDMKGDAVINMVYQIAAYTYGPLLGLFMFGIITKVKAFDRAVPFICITVPILCFVIEKYVFHFGFSLILVCAALTFAGILIFSKTTFDLLKKKH
ncbi:MAG: sodium:solute symporter [Prevotellaceae bacterium]|jgi:Na+/proline symporter|nr:sodium:solute symporter [Prevotellaceae bacterium]